jgi:hypothetical protein
MPLELKREGLPSDLIKQLSADEKIYFFSPVDFKGGCLESGGKGNYWAALTDKRLLYHAKVKEGDAYLEREGILNLKNITSVEMAEGKPSGCMASKYWELRVNASGAIIGLPFPNKQKGLEVRAIYYELTEREKS